MAVDPARGQYPNLSPYVYCAGNPLKYVDPSGNWIAEYDDEANKVTVKAEEGDTDESLYTQMGLSKEEFEKRYGSGKSTYDITDAVLSNNNFNPKATDQNCFGFVNFASGITNTNTEKQAKGKSFTSKLNSVESPVTGDIAVWSYNGNMSGKPVAGLPSINNDPAHAAIYIVSKSAGERQYLHRKRTFQPVSIGTNSRVHSTYNRVVNNFAKRGIKLPPIINTPMFFRR